MRFFIYIIIGLSLCSCGEEKKYNKEFAFKGRLYDSLFKNDTVPISFKEQCALFKNIEPWYMNIDPDTIPDSLLGAYRMFAAYYIGNILNDKKYTYSLYKVFGDDFSGMFIFAFDESGKPKNNILIKGGLRGGPWEDEQKHFRLCDYFNADIEGAKIKTYLKEHYMKDPGKSDLYVISDSTYAEYEMRDGDFKVIRKNTSHINRATTTDEWE